MTRKDYRILAEALREARPQTWPTNAGPWTRAVDNIAIALKADNPRFDRGKFLDACGMTEDLVDGTPGPAKLAGYFRIGG